jgi:hypothetical protein
MKTYLDTPSASFDELHNSGAYYGTFRWPTTNIGDLCPICGLSQGSHYNGWCFNSNGSLPTIKGHFAPELSRGRFGIVSRASSIPVVAMRTYLDTNVATFEELDAEPRAFQWPAMSQMGARCPLCTFELGNHYSDGWCPDSNGKPTLDAKGDFAPKFSRGRFGIPVSIPITICPPSKIQYSGTLRSEGLVQAAVNDLKCSNCGNEKYSQDERAKGIPCWMCGGKP